MLTVQCYLFCWARPWGNERLHTSDAPITAVATNEMLPTAIVSNSYEFTVSRQILLYQHTRTHELPFTAKVFQLGKDMGEYLRWSDCYPSLVWQSLRVKILISKVAVIETPNYQWKIERGKFSKRGRWQCLICTLIRWGRFQRGNV